MTEPYFEQRRARFRAVHDDGCFVIPNPWDIGSAKRLEKLGFQALASSSAAAAWALGKDDGELTLDEAIDHLAMLCRATDLPVNADFENGFADAPADVAANITSAIATGIAGISIEDRLQGTQTLYDFDQAVARVAAARAAIDASGADVMLVARTESYLVGNTNFSATMTRLTAFADAGADILFAPGMSDFAEIAECVKTLSPRAVNVLQWNDKMTVTTLGALGVRRISTGSALAKAAWAGFDRAASALLS